jgi:hypothetical protein
MIMVDVALGRSVASHFLLKAISVKGKFANDVVPVLNARSA